jgi:hypothetical protein
MTRTAATRVGSMGEIQTGEVCYFLEQGAWHIYIPACGVGSLANHQVEEHADGTITVKPSILLTGHEDGKPTQRHGFLERGEWVEAS